MLTSDLLVRFDNKSCMLVISNSSCLARGFLRIQVQTWALHECAVEGHKNISYFVMGSREIAAFEYVLGLLTAGASEEGSRQNP